MEADILITRVNESYVKLKCDPAVLREISDAFTFDVPNAKYSPAFKARRWDGKIRMVNGRNAQVLSGLTHKIIEFAQANNYSVNNETDFGTTESFSLQDALDFSKSLNLPYEARDYQLRAFALAVRHRRCVLISPTASGKSLIAYLITRHYNRKTLIIVPTTSLVMQMTSDFASYGYDQEIHQVTAGVEKSTHHKITISTWQSVFEQPESFFSDFDLIIGDEAHNFKAKSLISIMTKMNSTPYRIGMTGTLDGAEVHELVLRGLFGEIHRIVRTSELIKSKALANLKIQILTLKHSISMVGKTYAEEMEYIISSMARNRFIRNLATSLRGNTLVLFAYVEKHGKILHDMIREKHENTHFVSGEVEGEIREEIRSLVEKSDNAIIVASYGVFSTGVNIKNLHNIVFASPTKSRIRTLQSIGRGLRISASKDSCTLFDIADDMSHRDKKNFTLNHLIERVKMYNSEGFPYEIHTIQLKEQSNDNSLLFQADERR